MPLAASLTTLSSTSTLSPWGIVTTKLDLESGTSADGEVLGARTLLRYDFSGLSQIHAAMTLKIMRDAPATTKRWKAPAYADNSAPIDSSGNADVTRDTNAVTLLCLAPLSNTGRCFGIASVPGDILAEGVTFSLLGDGERPVVLPPARLLPCCSPCLVPSDWVQLPLIGRDFYNHNVIRLRFGLPASISLNLPMFSCMLVRGYDACQQSADRPYTATSDSAIKGWFEMLVKVYQGGVVSTYLATCDLGTRVEFKHTPECLRMPPSLVEEPMPATTSEEEKIQAVSSAGIRRITMLSSGTGILPMLGALQRVAGGFFERWQSNDLGGNATTIEAPVALRSSPESQITNQRVLDIPEVVLICGFATAADILLAPEIERLSAKIGPGRCKVVTLVGDARAAAAHGGGGRFEVGWVDAENIQKYAHPPDPSGRSLVFVCGIPFMYDLLCGPRDEPALRPGSVLGALGYSSQEVIKL